MSRLDFVIPAIGGIILLPLLLFGMGLEGIRMILVVIVCVILFFFLLAMFVLVAEMLYGLGDSVADFIEGKGRRKTVPKELPEPARSPSAPQPGSDWALAELEEDAIDYALAELDVDRMRVKDQIVSFHAKLQRDPISALNLRFIEGQGFLSDPFEFKGKILSGDVHVIECSGVAGEWTPPEYQEDGTTIRPVGGVLSKSGVAVAFRVSHQHPDFRLKLDWFKKSDPASGPVCLVDPVNHQYLYLTASSMDGEVLPGIPRTGILVFHKPDSQTDRLQVHFSDVSVSRDPRSKTSFSFEFTDAELPQTIEQLNALPTTSEALDTMLDREVSEIRSEFLRQDRVSTRVTHPES